MLTRTNRTSLVYQVRTMQDLLVTLQAPSMLFGFLVPKQQRPPRRPPWAVRCDQIMVSGPLDDLQALDCTLGIPLPPASYICQATTSLPCCLALTTKTVYLTQGQRVLNGHFSRYTHFLQAMEHAIECETMSKSKSSPQVLDSWFLELGWIYIYLFIVENQYSLYLANCVDRYVWNSWFTSFEHVVQCLLHTCPFGVRFEIHTQPYITQMQVSV